MNQEPVEPFDWQRLLLADYPWTYLGEVALRTVVMFTMLLLALRVSGKREVGQLSVFELVLVIGLGSAAGDPMFYDDVPLALPVVVFVVVMGCYKLITRLSDKHSSIRRKLEGVPEYVVKDGQIALSSFDEEDINHDELLSELRLAGIEHLGQVRAALLEMNGRVSVFRYADADVRPGLPILPDELRNHTQQIVQAGAYACCHCGNVVARQPGNATNCPRCGRSKLVRATQPPERSETETADVPAVTTS